MTNMVVFDLKPTKAYPADGRFVWEMQVWGLTPEKHVVELNLRADVSDSTLVVKDSIVLLENPRLVDSSQKRSGSVLEQFEKTASGAVSMDEAARKTQ